MLITFPICHYSGGPQYRQGATGSANKDNDMVITFASAPKDKSLLLFITNSNDGDFTGFPAGLTELTTGNAQFRCYYKVCGASEPTAYSFSGGRAGAKADHCTGAAIEITNNSTSSPIDGNTQSSGATMAAVTTTLPNDLVVLLCAGTGSTDYSTPPTGYTLAVRVQNSGPDCAIAYRTVIDTGSISPGSWSTSSGSNRTVAVK